MKFELINIERWAIVVCLFLFSFVEFNCILAQPLQAVPADSSNWIISQSIDAHGGGINSCILSFDFRDRNYKGIFNNGNFEMSRKSVFGDSVYVDKIGNDSFERSINETTVELPLPKQLAYSESINSVFYFAMLPYKLSDKAVISSYLGKQRIKNNEYYLVKVSFQAEGGGSDHQDQFRYWFNTKNYHLEYLAYSYESNGGGVRFRSVEKRHLLNDKYLFQDYVNFESDIDVEMNDLLKIYSNGGLKELSRIRLENMQIFEIKN